MNIAKTELRASVSPIGLARRQCSGPVFKRCSLRISIRTPAILTAVLRGFPPPLQTNSGIIYQLGRGRFLRNTFQLFIHYSSYHPTMYSLVADSFVKFRSRKPRLTTVGIRYPDHAKPSIRKSWH
jgi:hypothetical protein